MKRSTSGASERVCKNQWRGWTERDEDGRRMMRRRLGRSKSICQDKIEVGVAVDKGGETRTYRSEKKAK